MSGKTSAKTQPPPQLPTVSNAEWEIMKVMWDHGPLAARDVYALLPADHGWATKTVKTLLSRLVAKGALDYQQIGNSYLYRPACTREQVTRQEVRSFISRVLEGSLRPVIAHFVEEHNLTDDEISELQKLWNSRNVNRGGTANERFAKLAILALRLQSTAHSVCCSHRPHRPRLSQLLRSTASCIVASRARKTVLPPTLSAPWSLGSLAQHYDMSLSRLEPSKVSPEVPSIGYQDIQHSSEVADTPIAATPIESSTEIPTAISAPSSSIPAASVATQQPAAPARWSLTQWMFACWGVGTLLYLAYVVIPYVVLLRKLRSANRIDEGELAVLFHQLALRIAPTRTPPALLVSKQISSPFVYGLFHPTIAMPHEVLMQLTPDQLEKVLLHELTHWRRRDILVGWLQVVAQSIFWFHPLVWYANARLREERGKRLR